MKVIFADAVNGTFALGKPDRLEEAIANRTRMMAEHGLTPDDLLTFIPSHRPEVTVVTSEVMRAFREASVRPHCEALVAKQGPEKIGIGALAADCAGVALLDRRAGVAGIMHLSRDMLMDGLIDATLGQMYILGAQRIEGHIGPCLQTESHDLRDNQLASLIDSIRGVGRFIHRGTDGVARFDFSGCIADQLEQNGVHVAHRSRICTFGDERYYSYRRHERLGGAHGLQASVVIL